VEEKRASSTARLIAASLVFMHEHAEFAQLVSAESAALSWHFLRNCSENKEIFLNIVRQRWFYHVASIIEQLTIPGILRHYALRKKCLSNLVRDALADGIKQVVVLGAGFDPLALELHRHFEDVHFWEIDHPATQQYKTRELDFNVRLFHFVPANLQNAKIDAALLVDFNPAERSIWIAEGVLMYLPEQIVKEQFQAIANLSAPGSRIAFTFMKVQSDGRICFRKQTRLVNWWLKGRSEPFRWGINREELPRFIAPWRTMRIVDDAGLRELGSLSPNVDLAAGELICLAGRS
jgi:methyltransferase (TIGR00027 family)